MKFSIVFASTLLGLISTVAATSSISTSPLRSVLTNDLLPRDVNKRQTGSLGVCGEECTVTLISETKCDGVDLTETITSPKELFELYEKVADCVCSKQDAVNKHKKCLEDNCSSSFGQEWNSFREECKMNNQPVKEDGTVEGTGAAGHTEVQILGVAAMAMGAAAMGMMY